MINVGLDLGGTKIEAIVLDHNGHEVLRSRVSTPGKYQDCLSTIRALVNDVVTKARSEHSQLVSSDFTLGVGAPGTISPSTGVMRNANTTWLNGKPFRDDLCRLFNRPVKLANDANCLALSEAIDGAAAGVNTVFAVILGTGCGGGVVVNQNLVEGRNGVAGEWGHISLPWPMADETPTECWCGKRGCIEQWISGTGFARDFYARTGQSLSGEMIIKAARSGDEQAIAAYERLLSRIGRSLALVVNLMDPDVFVFGGGLSNVDEIYTRLPEYIRPYVFGQAWEAKLVKARHGDSSGVRGAAMLWRQMRDENAQLVLA